MRQLLPALLRRMLVVAILAGPWVGVDSRAIAAPELKVGVLKFGTVNWLMEVIDHHHLDKKHGFALSTVELASRNATAVALLAGEVDAIVTDWFWALRQREQGEDFVFFPYSVTLGAVMVPADSDIRSLADLKGKRIGVAGGPMDKSWILLRARAEALGAGDLTKTATPVFAAPPLLNEQMVTGGVDAVLNYWHFAARLEGDGYRKLVEVSQLMTDLGLGTPPPLIGFVFRQATAGEKSAAIAGFAASTVEAGRILSDSDEEWERLRPRMGAGSDGQFEALKRNFRAGTLRSWGEAERGDAARLFAILAELGGDKLTGKGVTFDPAVFWSGFTR